MVQNMNNNLQDELDEDLHIDFKKIAFAIWNRKRLIETVFIITLLFFVSLTFILPKKYVVDADLYISKSNNSNMMELNPYAIEESGSAGGFAAAMFGDQIQNEVELMQSAKVIDNVIRENDIRVKKLFGIIKTKKYGQYVKADKFIKKINIENKKGTNVVTISYKYKDPEKAYNVVSSLIKNYDKLHTELNTEKSQADIEVLENEYNKAKAELNKKSNEISGIPQSALGGSSNMAAMSAFSTSAQKAMSRIEGQFIAGQKSQIAVQEEATKVGQLAARLERAKLIKEISDSSKIVVLKEPQHLKDFEQASPKLFWQIVFGIIFGFIFSINALIFKELFDSKLTYSMLGDVIIYNVKNEFNKVKMLIFNNEDKKIGFIAFENVPSNIRSKLQTITNLNIIRANISKEFKANLSEYDAFILFVKVNNTDAEQYKFIKEMISDKNKIIAEILI